MCANNCEAHRGLINGFAWWQKLLLRTGFYGMMVVGIVGIWQQSPLWGLVYAALALVGVGWLVLKVLCSHCPYPSHYNDCLFLPPALVRRLFPYQGPNMSRAGKIIFPLVFSIAFVMPLFWLWASPGWLALYLGLTLPFGAAFPLHFCKRCRHFSCPMNQVPGSAQA